MSGFVLARDLGEALEALAAGGGQVLAGGTDLMVQLRQARLMGEEPPSQLVDVSRAPELLALELEAEQGPYLGAGLTFALVAQDPAIRAALPVLASAAVTVGSVQVRHTATLGGNAANASPAADGVSALLALGARARVASLSGRRSLPLEEVILSPGKNSLQAGEIIQGLELDRLSGPWGQVFAKVGRRQAVAVARLNLAVCLDRDLNDPRVVLGACFPSPRRLRQVEELLRGGSPGPELWQEAGELAASSFTNVCGWRSSSAYKAPAITRVTRRALALAWQRAGGVS